MRIKPQKPGIYNEFELGPWLAGIDEKTDASGVGANALRAAENVVLDEVPGQVTKRFGNVRVKAIPSGLPPKFGYEYSRSDGNVYLLLSDGVTLYATQDLVSFSTLITGLDDTAYLEFETLDDKCWIMNGTDSDMWFDGTNFVVMDHEYGNVTPATTKTGSSAGQIVDASLPNNPVTPADVTYWVNRRVVITSGTQTGMDGVVTAFNPTTRTLTIAGFDNDPGVGSSYMVGLIPPKGRIVRANAATLFIGGTTENRSEIRFNRLDDPDTGIKMRVDNPRAWPPEYQLAITQDDGDQVWTFSPEYRNRVLVTKGTAIFRLEPDATYIYVPVLVSQEVGCRFPDAWAVKDERLHFFGAERSGMLDLYVTDMVSVKPLHKEGPLLPSFEQMQRSEPTYKFIARASADQFNTGNKSTSCETKNGRLEPRVFQSQSDFNEVMAASSGAHASAESDSVVLDGIPAWPVKYEANELPQNANPPFSRYNGGTVSVESLTDVPGKLHMRFDHAGFAGVGYYRDTVNSPDKNAMLAVRFNDTLGFEHIILSSGTKIIYLNFSSNGPNLLIAISGRAGYITAAKGYHTFHLLLDRQQAASVYMDGARIWTGSAANSSDYTEFYNVPEGQHDISFYALSNDDAYLDFIYSDADFDLTCADLPAVLPSVGTVSLVLDYKRTPDSFNKAWLTFGSEYQGAATNDGGLGQVIDTALPGEDGFWTGRQIVFTSGVYDGFIYNITGYTAATHLLTIDGGFTGALTGATYYILRGGSVAMTTQSSADGITYSAPAAVAFAKTASQQTIYSPLARFLKINLALTAADYANGPEVTALTAGFLWTMGAQQIGSNISAWRSFLTDIEIPLNAALTTKIRFAKTIAAPAETDFGAWVAIATLDNIGTKLADPTAPDTFPPSGCVPPQGRWLDVKVEGGIGDGWGVGYLDNFTLNWQEGSNSRLIVAAFTYKKRFYLTGISAAAVANDRLFVLDTKSAWTKFTDQNLNRLVSFRGQVYGLSSVDAYICQQEVDGKFDDNGTDVVAMISTGALDFGHQRFELQTIKCGSVGITSNVEAQISYNGVDWVSAGFMAFTTDGTMILRVPRGRIGKQHFVKLLGSDAEGFAVNMLKVGGVAFPEER